MFRVKKIEFTKMVASGNDFVVIDKRQKSIDSTPKALAKEICDRKFGIGADGLLALEKSKIADVRMRIFNADGSEAEMCGNGARCVALYISPQSTVSAAGGPAYGWHSPDKRIKIETKAGIIESEVKGGNVKIKLTDPKDIKLNLPIKVNPVRNTEALTGQKKISNGVNKKTLRVNFINTGVPHTVIFAQGLEKIAIVNLGRQVRYHERFIPAGTNVDFVEVLDNNSIRVRTYERGVEDETLACGTGAAASALITVHSQQSPPLPKADAPAADTASTVHSKINVYTKGGEILRVYFKKVNNTFKDVWLEGKVRVVYTGVYYV